MGEECPQDCGYIIIHQADTPAEEAVCEDGFETIDDAKQAATQALAHVLERSPLSLYLHSQGMQPASTVARRAIARKNRELN